jgi:hypothetical protein
MQGTSLPSPLDPGDTDPIRLNSIRFDFQRVHPTFSTAQSAACTPKPPWSNALINGRNRIVLTVVQRSIWMALTLIPLLAQENRRYWRQF